MPSAAIRETHRMLVRVITPSAAVNTPSVTVKHAKKEFGFMMSFIQQPGANSSAVFADSDNTQVLATAILTDPKIQCTRPERQT